MSHSELVKTKPPRRIPGGIPGGSLYPKPPPQPPGTRRRAGRDEEPTQSGEISSRKQQEVGDILRLEE